MVRGAARGDPGFSESAMRGKQMDLSALKQEIQDDAGLLSNWRKAFPGCRSGRSPGPKTHDKGG